MAESIKDSDIFESDCDDARIHLKASLEDKRCNFSWKQPWEKFEIKVCLPNGESIAQTDCTKHFSPLKIQFLKSHHLEGLQRIIQDIPTIEVKSVIFKEQLFEITLKSESFANQGMKILTGLMKPCDDVIIRQIQRQEFTSKLVKSIFRNHIQEKIEVFRDESTIFIVGYQTMKGCIDDRIVQINRSTVTKTIIFKEKWQTIALTKFGIITDLMQKKDDVSIVLQDQTGRICIQGSKEDVAKAEDQLQQMLKCVSVEYISFDPLILKLLLFKEALEHFNETLKINNINIEWIVDDEKLCAFGKHNVNSDEIKSVLYTNFVSVGFGDASAECGSFCKSQYFNTITTKYMNKMLVCERTTQCVYLAATKTIVQELLFQEKVHNPKTTHTAAVKVNITEKMLDQLTTDKNQLEAQLDNEIKENTKKTDDIKRGVQERQRLQQQVEKLQLKLNASENAYITTETILKSDKIQLRAQLDNEITENTKKTEDIKRSVQERQRLEKQVEELQLKLNNTTGKENETIPRPDYRFGKNSNEFTPKEVVSTITVGDTGQQLFEPSMQAMTEATIQIPYARAGQASGGNAQQSINTTGTANEMIPRPYSRFGKNSNELTPKQVVSTITVGDTGKRLFAPTMPAMKGASIPIPYASAGQASGGNTQQAQGTQPEGKMSKIIKKYSLSGFEGTDTIEIEYRIYAGKQGEEHPTPGIPFMGTTRVAYLPDNCDGQLIAKLLKIAFDRKLIFTIGTSTTTGKTGVVTWNDILHKTNHRPNTEFGYPDETYFKRVLEELAAKGVTEKDLKD